MWEKHNTKRGLAYYNSINNDGLGGGGIEKRVEKEEFFF